ncbi:MULTISPECIES: hypothetical protein [unclassified Eubacterium (in: firmicutes)]|uniref:hypothetical protein n=1 Tax=unclassified Eubacterium (in: firmicutes) TaxID=2624479 RepID=UPI000335DB4E|nr:hypothetical protein [Eubacterium sp. LMAG:50]CDA29890.1 uncharacterized protein BN504_01392 [Eubacterium sp. CAG:156]
MVRRKTSEGFARVMSKVLKYLVMFVVIYYFAAAAFVFGRQLFTDKGAAPAPGMDMTIEVTKNTSIKDFAKTLEEYGIINDDKVLWVQSFIYEVKVVKPGTYTFNTSDNGEEILKVIKSEGKTDEEETTTE